MSEEEIIWLDENSPHDPLAEAIYSELHFQRYKEYLKLGKKLRKSKHLELFANEIQIRFELDGRFLKIEYFIKQMVNLYSITSQQLDFLNL